MKRKRKHKLNKIDKYIIVLSALVLMFIAWCAWEFHCGRDEPTALIGLVGAYVVTELFSLARIKVAKENNSTPPGGPDEPAG